MSLDKIVSSVTNKLKGIETFDPTVKHHWQGYVRYYGRFFADYLNYKYKNVCAVRDSSLSFINVNT